MFCLYHYGMDLDSYVEKVQKYHKEGSSLKLIWTVGWGVGTVVIFFGAIVYALNLFSLKKDSSLIQIITPPIVQQVGVFNFNASQGGSINIHTEPWSAIYWTNYNRYR